MSVNQIDNWNHLIRQMEIDFSPNKTVIELKLGFIQTSFVLLWSREVLSFYINKGLISHPLRALLA